MKTEVEIEDIDNIVAQHLEESAAHLRGLLEKRKTKELTTGVFHEDITTDIILIMEMIEALLQAREYFTTE